MSPLAGRPKNNSRLQVCWQRRRVVEPLAPVVRRLPEVPRYHLPRDILPRKRLANAHHHPYEYPGAAARRCERCERWLLQCRDGVPEALTCKVICSAHTRERLRIAWTIKVCFSFLLVAM
jgi:hypothetical protein